MAPGVDKTAGGEIATRLGLTCEATAAVAVGDPVMITGPYEVQKADGTKPCVGTVLNIRKDVPAAGGNRVATVPGMVSINALGVGVKKMKSGGALATAGVLVGVNGAGKIAAAGAGVSTIGVLLTTATGVDQDVDVLLGVYA